MANYVAERTWSFATPLRHRCFRPFVSSGAYALSFPRCHGVCRRFRSRTPLIVGIECAEASPARPVRPRCAVATFLTSRTRGVGASARAVVAPI